LSNSIKVLLVGVVLVAVGAAAIFVILPDTEESTGSGDATLTAADTPTDGPTFQRNLVDGPVREAAVIEDLPADVAAFDDGDVERPDREERRSAKREPDTQITGRVLDGAGRPVEGAAVSYVREPMSMMALSMIEEGDRPTDLLVETMTDREGRFALDGRSAKRNNDGGGGGFISIRREPQLVVQHDAFATLVHSCETLEAGAWSAGDLVLEPGASIVGRVVDGSGRGIAGAEVSAANLDDGRGRRGMRIFGMSMFGGVGQQLDAVETGADGRFAVRGLMPGVANVTARKEGLRLGAVEDVELEAHVPADVGDIVMEEGVSISGIVLNEVGEPLEGATVSVSSMARIMINRIEDLPRGQIGQEMGQRATSDENGVFELGGLVGGTYNVHVNADGYAALTQADVAAGTRNIRLEPERLGGLLVTLISARDGQPIDDADIAASTMGGWSRSWRGGGGSPVLEGADALARAGEEGDPEGMYLVEHAGLEGTELTVAAEGFGTTSVEAPAVASATVGTMTIELQPESIVAGFVVDGEGNPIERARVTMRAIEPQEDGFQFGRGGMRFAREINIHAGGDHEEGERPPDAEQLRTRTGYDGSFEIRGAAAGEWELTASGEGFARSDVTSLTLAEGQEQRDVKVELVKSGSIAGYVTEADGTPVDEARVLVEARSSGGTAVVDEAGRMERRLASMFGGGGGNQGPWRSRTDADGHYEVTGLAPGEYEVKLDGGPGGGGMRGVMVFIGDDAAEDEEPAVWTTVAEGVEARVDLVAPKRSVVRGRVSAGGQPAADVTVRLRTDSPFAFGGEGTQTNAFGEYEFTDVEAGDYLVTSIVPGAALEEKTNVKVDAGQTVNADLVFGGATLSGKVVDMSSGFGVPGVTLTAAPSRDGGSGGGDGMFGGGSVTMAFEVVEARGPGGPSGMSIDLGGGSVSNVKTDASGNFELKYLKPGKYTVEASGGGYTTGSIGPFDLTDGQDKDDLEVEVQKGAIIEGLVHSGETGARLDKVPVRLSGDGVREMSATEDGAYRFEGLEPGDYTVEVLGSGWGADAIAGESITLDEGEVRKLDLITGD
jgi:protocatechuate 3,4-dioxygenase beta subunit